jgi:hypothetical protein
MFSELTGPVQPWWRIRMMWLAIGGPLLVVAASAVTLVLAIQGRDRPVVEAGTARADASAPALQARNHAGAPRR